MPDKKEFDFGKLMDSFIGTAKNISDNLAQKGGEFIKDSGLQELKDYYPFYSWPPLNLYSSEDKCLIFEFGLAGFVKDDIKITFSGDYMVFSAKLSNLYSTGAKVRSFKKKLKLSDIEEQRYYVPEDRFNRDNFKKSMKNGLLRIIFEPIPGKELAFNEE